jgi:hypothetical protein
LSHIREVTRSRTIIYSADNIQKSRQNEWKKAVTEKVHGFFGTNKDSHMWRNGPFDINKSLTALHAVATKAEMYRKMPSRKALGYLLPRSRDWSQ